LYQYDIKPLLLLKIEIERGKQNKLNDNEENIFRISFDLA